MTRKNAMLDPNMRHLRDVNQGLWNRLFTGRNVLHPENWTPQNPQISRAFAGAFRMNSKRFDLSPQEFKKI